MPLLRSRNVRSEPGPTACTRPFQGPRGPPEIARRAVDFGRGLVAEAQRGLEKKI